VARKHDLCVLDVGEKIGDVVWDRVRLEFLDQPFAEIEAALYQLLRLKQLKRACIDATGLGMQLAERARQKFGWKIEPLTFTERTKEDLAISLKIDLEKRHLRLVDDEKLRADLRGIRKEVTLGGHSRYAGESEGSHCDRFWAKALRQQAARHRISGGALVG
jgi:phage FluMu gp28-like protein